jgi:hypothetical protein
VRFSDDEYGDFGRKYNKQLSSELFEVDLSALTKAVFLMARKAAHLQVAAHHINLLSNIFQIFQPKIEAFPIFLIDECKD